MKDRSKEQVRRLAARIEALEARNAALRKELEQRVHGGQPAWTPFQEATECVFGDGRVVGIPGKATMWVNSRYQVSVFEPEGHGFEEGRGLLHLSIRRLDGAAIRDWRDLQRIKNEIVGRECEGVELFPAESRLVDGANQYHVFCIPGQFPFGFRERLVSEDNTDGVQQRAFDPELRPDDLSSVTVQDMARVAGLEES